MHSYGKYPNGQLSVCKNDLGAALHAAQTWVNWVINTVNTILAWSIFEPACRDSYTTFLVLRACMWLVNL